MQATTLALDKMEEVLSNNVLAQSQPGEEVVITGKLNTITIVDKLRFQKIQNNYCRFVFRLRSC